MPAERLRARQDAHYASSAVLPHTAAVIVVRTDYRRCLQTNNNYYLHLFLDTVVLGPRASARLKLIKAGHVRGRADTKAGSRESGRHQTHLTAGQLQAALGRLGAHACNR